RTGTTTLRAPPAAAAAFSGRNEPLHTHVCLGKRASVKGLSEIHSNQFNLIPFGRGQYCAAIPAPKHTGVGSSLRSHMLHGAMQRFRAKPRFVCTRSIPFDD